MSVKNSFISTVLSLLLLIAAGFLLATAAMNYKPKSDKEIIESFVIQDLRAVRQKQGPLDVDLEATRTDGNKLVVTVTNNTSRRVTVSRTASAYTVEVTKTPSGQRYKVGQNPASVYQNRGYLDVDTTKHIEPYSSEEITYNFESIGLFEGSYILDIDGNLLYFTLGEYAK